MTSLKDIDRPTTTIHYARWNRDVVMRPIGAKDLFRMKNDFGHLQGADAHDEAEHQDIIAFYCELLAHVVEDPTGTEDEWNDLDPRTIVDLGIEALKISGLANEEAADDDIDAKKNSTDHSAGSALHCAENSESSTPTDSTGT